MGKLKCQNPYCGNSLWGKREHAQTCSPRCRKIVWKISHNLRLRRHSKLPTVLPAGTKNTTARRGKLTKKGRGK